LVAELTVKEELCLQAETSLLYTIPVVFLRGLNGLIYSTGLLQSLMRIKPVVLHLLENVAYESTLLIKFFRGMKSSKGMFLTLLNIRPL